MTFVLKELNKTKNINVPKTFHKGSKWEDPDTALFLGPERGEQEESAHFSSLSSPEVVKTTEYTLH